MAWTTPGTAVAGAVLEADLWNSDVRDNTQYLKDQSDFLYTPPMCVVSRSSGLTYSTSGVAITWNSEDVDTDSMYTSGTPTTITINTAGVYIVNLVIHFSATSVGATYGVAAIKVGGSYASRSGVVGTISGNTYVSTTLVQSLSASSAITAQFDMSGAAGTQLINTSSYMSALWVGTP